MGLNVARINSSMHFLIFSVVGAIILLLGFYAVLWGKAKEQKSKEYDSKNLGASTDAHTPLFAKSG